MKKTIFLILCLSLVAGIGYTLYNPLFRERIYKIFNPSSCDYPIHYSIGNIDEKFNLTRSEFLDDMSQASHIWDSAYGKQLFIFDSQNSNDLQVNLVYDTRQALNSKIYSLKNDLDTQKNSLEPKINEYNTRSADFRKRVAALNSQISYWNNHEGAPQDIYQKLITEQQSLQQEASQLNTMAKSLNQSTDQFNIEAGQLNQTVNTFNSDLKLKPEEGLYIPQDNKINVYFNNSHQELVHTLAHELGHALGLDHNANQESIMFAYTTQAITPSIDDLNSLQTACARHTVIELLFNRMKLVYQRIFKQS